MYKLELDLTQDPPYNPETVPSDFYLFSHLQLHLDGSVFSSNEEVKKQVVLFLDSNKPQFFAEDIEKLPKLWQEVIFAALFLLFLCVFIDLQ